MDTGQRDYSCLCSAEWREISNLWIISGIFNLIVSDLSRPHVTESTDGGGATVFFKNQKLGNNLSNPHPIFNMLDKRKFTCQSDKTGAASL